MKMWLSKRRIIIYCAAAILVTFVMLSLRSSGRSSTLDSKCRVLPKVRENLLSLMRVTTEVLTKLKLNHFLCYETLWGALKVDDLLPWEDKVEFCALNEELVMYEEAFLIKFFLKRNLALSYDSKDGVYEIYFTGKRDSGTLKLIVFETDKRLEMCKRVGWSRRLLPPDCQLSPSLQCFPTRLIEQPLPTFTVGNVRYKVPREEIEIQKYLYPDTWWKDSKPKDCKAFDITYVRLKFHSPRPESFAIYKRTSEDGRWIPYQYYSASCKQTYGISEGNYLLHQNETQALCTSEYSDISPLTGGNVAFSTLEGRPSAYNFENSPILQEWVTATDIRITLDRLNTFGDEVFGDPKVLQSYYYAISDFAVGGRCKCNGHASRCIRRRSHDNQGILECACEHNTAGPDCNECLPFYNDQPWGRATAENSHECKACNCNQRSEKCYFDKELYARTGHGGHCIDCRGNTDGPNCERCKENYYERADTNCVPCNCDRTGSRNLQCDRQGKCQCKPGVTGDKCDRCQLNYYDFGSYGCRACGCNEAGSLGNTPSCDPNTGICRCKENVEGQQCDKCKPGYFNLNLDDEFGCTACFCFGHASVCNSDPGYRRVTLDSSFTRDRERWAAVDIHGQTVPTQYNAITQNIGVHAPRDTVYYLAPERYLGDHRFSYGQMLSFNLRTNSSDARASSHDVVVESGTTSISQPIYGQKNPLPSSQNQEYRFRLHEHSNYGWSPKLTTHQFVKLLNNITAIKIRASYNIGGIGFLNNVKLESASRSGYGADVRWVEMCSCPEGYIGQFCESCAPGYRHKPANGGPFSVCVPCDCHGHADICDADTGRCICQHDTAGDHCDRCERGFYGNALKGTPNDCQPCPCPGKGACVELLSGEVVCVECPAGYAGPRCDMCTDGYFGDPNGLHGPKISCEKCECNGNIDLNAVGNCNRTSGECLKCIFYTTGSHCEKCLSGYYGDALLSTKGDCKPCNCYLPGTVPDDRGPSMCNPVTGQCQCLPHVTGRRCDVCEDGYWAISGNQGCQACNCDPLGSVGQSCDIRTGECKCQPGVVGQKCDKCAPHHYGFSATGCTACDCDPVGSYDRSCDASGQCRCNPNVEGRRCDRCKENTYNKSAGCIDCPPCYDLVQDSADLMRQKLKDLEELLNLIEQSPGFENDADFEDKLREVQRRVDDLLRDAKNAQGTDGDIVAILDELRNRIKEVEKVTSKFDTEIAKADGHSKEGIRNITLAEEAIARAKEALKNAQRYVENEGYEALKQAQEQAKKFGQQSERMTQISRQARLEADKQEADAKDIENIANEALNTSSQAYTVARNAIDKQKETSDEIRKLKNDQTANEQLLEQTKRVAKDALKRASDAYDDALDSYTDAQGLTIPVVDVPTMIDNAGDIIEEAKRIQADADELQNRHKNLLDGLDDQIAEAENLLATGSRHQQEADALLAEVDAAHDKATKAVEMGDRTLNEASATLETLKKFDQSVRESKDKANDALATIPEIEELIQEAKYKTGEARDELSSAEHDAGEARRIALEAKMIAERSSRDAEGIRKEADRTKERAQKLKDTADDQAREIADADARLNNLTIQAENDKNLANDALKKANEAKHNANEANEMAKDALKAVEGIIEQMGNLTDVDKDQLDKLRRRLDKAEEQMNAADLDKRLAALRDERALQNQWVRDYTAEIERLKADVANVKTIADTLPDKCFRSVILEP
ncbi:Laminin B (Domain IV) [Chamberlinius hualienensis]